jgi:MoxR-like ATPase
MKTLITHDGKFLAPLTSANGREPEALLARERISLFASQPPGSQEMNLDDFLAGMRALGTEIKSQLISMDEEIDLVLVGLLTGENVFFLSLPGAAKTTLARMVAKGIDGRFFRINLNPDVSRNDLFGPLDPNALRDGRWSRRLSGLATATVANLDELFKASGAVLNMLLETYEEHTLTEPDAIHHLPLLLGIAASNELVNAVPQNAIWDRILIRKEIGYPTRQQHWEGLLDCMGGRKPITTRLDPEEILLGQALVEYKAMSLPREIKSRMVKVRMQLSKVGLPISPRRFIGWGRAAVAHSLLRGESEMSPKSLLIGQHILWIGLEDRDDVRNIVSQISDPERQILLSAAADVEEIMSRIGGEENLQALVGWRTKLTKHGKLIDARVLNPDLEREKQDIIERVQTAQSRLVDRAGEVMERRGE